MADFAAFGQPDFNVTTWVNAALRARDSDQSLDALISSLVSKLQAVSLQLSASLEEQSSAAVANMPSAVREIERVQREAASTRRSIQSIETVLRQIETETGESVRSLAELDRVKTALERTQRALAEVSRAARVTAELDAAFDAGNVRVIASRVHSVSASIDVLQHVPEYQEQRERIAGYRARLEQLLVPRVAPAVHEKDTDALQEVYQAFAETEDTSRFTSLYTDALIANLRPVWSQHVRSATRQLPASPSERDAADDADAAAALAAGLDAFAEATRSVLADQARWLAGCLSESDHVVAAAAEGVAAAFADDITDAVMQTLQLQPVIDAPTDPALASVERIPALLNLAQLVSRHAIAVAGLVTRDDDAAARTRVLLAWHRCLHPLHRGYPALEQHQLWSELAAVPIGAGAAAAAQYRDLASAVAALEAAAPAILRIAGGAMPRCTALTAGTEAVALVSVLDAFLTEAVQRMQAVLARQRRLARLDGDDDVTDKRDDADADAAAYDWSLLSSAMQLLQHSDSFATRALGVDAALRQALQETAQHLAQASPSPLTYMAVADSVSRRQELSVLLDRAADPHFRFLSGAAQHIESWHAYVQRFVYDLLLHPMSKRVAGLASWSVWRDQGAAHDADATTRATARPTSLPTFSQSPQSYVTEIGEHLWTLPQQLAPYSSSSDADVSMRLLPPPDLTGSLDDSPDDGRSAATSPALPSARETTRDERTAEAGASRGGFAGEWLGALAMGVMTTLLREIDAIATLSDTGAQQLVTDLNYLLNVFRAIAVDPPASMPARLAALTAPRDTFWPDVSTHVSAHDRLVGSIARQRGVAQHEAASTLDA